MASGKKLGRGLNSLLATHHAGDGGESTGQLWVPVGKLQPNRDQPRQDAAKGLDRLADSIRRHGVLQPIVVAPLATGEYEIVAGERRWRAARKAGLKAVPVIVRAGVETGPDRLELALIENIQREDLDPIERGKACQKLLTEHGLTQEELAGRLGYDRSTVANLVRLLDLPTAIQDAVSRGTITGGHARALLRLQGTPSQDKVFKRLVAEEWSVRSTEAACAAEAGGKVRPLHRARPQQPPWVQDLQERMTRQLGAKAEIRLLRRGGGRVVLHFQDLEDLDRLTGRLRMPGEAEELMASP